MTRRQFSRRGCAHLPGMTHANSPIPIRPVTRPGANDTLAAAVPRAMFCAFRSKVDPAVKGRDFDDVCRQIFPGDHAALTLLKSAVTPGSTTAPGFASELIHNTVGVFLASLAPASAIAGIMQAGFNADMQSFGEHVLPFRATAPVARPWVPENAAIAVTQYQFQAVTLGPASKVGIIATASRELIRRAFAEAIFTQMVRDDAAISLDSAYLSTAAAATGSQAGLLNGVTPLPAVSSGLSPKDQMADDLAALGSAVAAGGFGAVAFIMSPARAIRVQIKAPDLQVPVLPSVAVPDHRVIAVDPVSIVHGFGSDPDALWSQEAVIHMDTEPLPISDGGVTAAPVRSLWQTDAVATRMILDVAFSKRRANAVAFMDDVSAW